MRKALVVVTVLALGIPSLAWAHHGPASVTIKAAAKKQPAVTFKHDQHATTLVKTCETCHHMNKGLTPDTVAKTKVQKCTTCHLDPKGSVPSMREASMTKNPFHALCIDCHKQQKKGPTVCKDCHKK
jgi:hypothetical protein